MSDTKATISTKGSGDKHTVTIENLTASEARVVMDGLKGQYGISE